MRGGAGGGRKSGLGEGTVREGKREEGITLQQYGEWVGFSPLDRWDRDLPGNSCHTHPVCTHRKMHSTFKSQNKVKIFLSMKLCVCLHKCKI